jgi:flagellar hook-associated protein 1 FlgK
MSIGSLLFTARDALMTNQLAIDITGGNIANINTPGYSRQRADLVSVGGVNLSSSTSTYIGVDISRVVRVFDRFIESQVIDQQQNKGYGDALLQSMQNIEVILDDTSGGGISDQLTKFWASWENLSANPAGTVERNALLSSAETLTGAISAYRENLVSINTDLNRNIEETASQINGKIDELADVNSQIIQMQSDSGEKNDLLDKRTTLLGELSLLTTINYTENADGTVNVYMPSGDSLLDQLVKRPLSVTVNSSTDESDVFISGNSSKINSMLTGGKIGAYIDLQDTYGTASADVRSVTGTGSTGTVEATGIYTGDVSKTYAIRITGAGATYDLSTDGGSTWTTPVPNTVTTTISLDDGVTLNATGSFIANDTFYVDVGGKVIDSLNAFTNALATEVNNLHSTGFDAYQNTGINFFTLTNGILEVNDPIVADIKRIAASASVTGDGEMASSIAAIQDKLTMNGDSTSMSNFLAAIVGRIGKQTSDAATNNDHQTMITNYLNNQRESISGVSLDEEMLRLIQYQMGYNAAGKLVTTVNDMLDVLMGLVK